MTFDTLTLSLPAHWLGALFNGDPSGLDEAEYTAFLRWETDTVNEFGYVAYGLPGDAEPYFARYHGADAPDAPRAEPYFARYHDAAEYGVLACDCYDVTLCFEAAPVPA